MLTKLDIPDRHKSCFCEEFNLKQKQPKQYYSKVVYIVHCTKSNMPEVTVKVCDYNITVLKYPGDSFNTNYASHVMFYFLSSDS